MKGASTQWSHARFGAWRHPEWRRVPKWHWRKLLLRQTWRLVDWHYDSESPGSPADRPPQPIMGYTNYKTDTQMANHYLAERYDPNHPNNCAAGQQASYIAGVIHGRPKV